MNGLGLMKAAEALTAFRNGEDSEASEVGALLLAEALQILRSFSKTK